MAHGLESEKQERHVVFHYPPELLELLVSTIPLLCRSKKATLQFFTGAGAPEKFTRGLSDRLNQDPGSISKYEIARTMLAELNLDHQTQLRALREVVRRVVEFEDFSSCWPNDVLKAKGLIAEVRRVVNVKDSFTQMREEAERRSGAAREAANRQQDELRHKEAAWTDLKRRFFELFQQGDAHKRGKQLEAVLNDLFRHEGILVRDAFTIKGDCCDGVIEQIDGVIELDGHLYLVELKWWNKPLGPGDVAQHLVRVYGRGTHARGIFFSYTDFTAAAALSFKEGISGGALVVAGTLDEIVSAFDRTSAGGTVAELLRRKIRLAVIEKSPLVKLLN